MSKTDIKLDSKARSRGITILSNYIADMKAGSMERFGEPSPAITKKAVEELSKTLDKLPGERPPVWATAKAQILASTTAIGSFAGYLVNQYVSLNSQMAGMANVIAAGAVAGFSVAVAAGAASAITSGNQRAVESGNTRKAIEKIVGVLSELSALDRSEAAVAAKVGVEMLKDFRDDPAALLNKEYLVEQVSTDTVEQFESALVGTGKGSEQEDVQPVLH